MNTKKVLEEAKELDKKYNIFITINENFDGKFPLAVKDNICTKDILTTAGSKILHNYYPVFDATAIEKLKKRGAGIIGKTVMDEFGFGTFSTNCAYKIPKNPHDPKRCCGGSSGGSAAYIAASKYAEFAIGQSTGGSITCPAAFCGVVGLTPTYGLVSRYGLIDYANSLDKIGVLAKSVEKASSCLQMIIGHDSKDSTSVKKKQGIQKKKITIGIPKEYFANVDKRIVVQVMKYVKKLEKDGFKVKKISLPHTKYAVPAYYIIALSEASTNLAKFCGLRYGLSYSSEEKGFNEYFSEVRTAGFGEEAKRRIILGTYVRMAGYRDQYYLKALKVRTLIIRDFKEAFKKVDVLIAPSMPMIAPKFSEIEKLTSLQQYTSDILTVAPNLAGIPQLSIPCGFVDKMPIGMQILGDYFREDDIIAVGKQVEKYG
ncbi:MAG: Asp-tRNA(Asn)/Glu-tRNA(Gln) amidotransferase subunit GatA [Nanoarchaeota archaeon]|nr:Asp-tRNA(Asn)/Glu-tRNA(Gln) amidotransferase subunit GatA [Nanoarchaeota archaeon]MBU4124049.1 Asp-tRNA(Asn)/Glu-tRNA(Gln) amidotransferase subunit GatA [Nanoarchaeota archaeon]